MREWQDEWVAEVGRANGWGGQVVPVPSALLPAGLAPDLDWRYHLATDTGRFREQFGFVEGEVRRRTIACERAHPPREIGPGLFDYAAEDAALALVRRR